MASTKIYRTFTSGNTDKWTWSAWVKRGTISATQGLFAGHVDDQNRTDIKINGSDQFVFEHVVGNSYVSRHISNRLFRDTGAWYHFVVAVDTTQGTAANRTNMYVNGVLMTEFDIEEYPDQNDEFKLMQNSQLFSIAAGHGGNNSTNGLGYYADFIIVDEAQKAATDFGEFDEDSGQWIAKKYTGSCNSGSGTNGGHYKFEGTDEGTGGGATGLDSSGNSNTINFRNMKGGKTDTPTNNFCT